MRLERRVVELGGHLEAAEEAPPLAAPAPARHPRARPPRRAAHEAERKIDEISLREIANAMDHLEAGTGGMDEAELFRDTLAEFGFLRMTDGVRGRLAAAVRLRRVRSDI